MYFMENNEDFCSLLTESRRTINLKGKCCPKVAIVRYNLNASVLPQL